MEIVAYHGNSRDKGKRRKQLTKKAEILGWKIKNAGVTYVLGGTKFKVYYRLQSSILFFRSKEGECVFKIKESGGGCIWKKRFIYIYLKIERIYI